MPTAGRTRRRRSPAARVGKRSRGICNSRKRGRHDLQFYGLRGARGSTRDVRAARCWVSLSRQLSRAALLALRQKDSQRRVVSGRGWRDSALAALQTEEDRGRMKPHVVLLAVFLALSVACFGMGYTAYRWTSDVVTAGWWSLLGAGC